MQAKFLLIAIILIALIQTASATTYYCDPANGNTATGDGSASNPWGTLQSVMEAGKFNGTIIKSGDTVKLRSGHHGYIKAVNYDNTDYITIEPDKGQTPVFTKFRLIGSEKWIIRGITATTLGVYLGPSGSSSPLIGAETHNSFGGSKDIIIEDSTVYNIADSSGWDANDWVTRTSYGIKGEGGYGAQNIIIRNNYVKNVRHGISLGGTGSLAENNVIENFYGDGMYGGSNTIIQYNTIKYAYKAGGARVIGTDTNTYKTRVRHTSTPDTRPITGANWSTYWTLTVPEKIPTEWVSGILYNTDIHNDGIQLIANNPVSNVTIRGNYILTYKDPAHPLTGGSQGILGNPGVFSNLLIENNLILIDHDTQGISIHSPDNSIIINNTVILPPGSTKKPYIRFYENSSDYDGTHNTVVRNNISTSFPTGAGPGDVNVSINHNLDFDDYDPNVLFIDYMNYNAHLRQGSPAIDTGNSDLAPDIDKDKNSRPQGAGFDIGAYEFQSSAQQACAGTDTSCGTYPNCANCDLQDSCIADSNRNYYCSGTSCTYTDDSCSDCTCNCGGFKTTETTANNNCSDAKDNDCDTKTDAADEECQTTECTQDSDCPTGQTCQNSACAAECIDNNKLLDYISQWKQGSITLLALMQKMKQWKAGTGC